MILARRNLFTIPCESIFNAHPAVARSALGRSQAAGPGRARDLHRAARPLSGAENRTASGRNCSSEVRRFLIHGELERCSLSCIHFPSISATTPRSFAKSWPSGHRGDCHESAEALARYLVTGGGGFLGTALVELLVERGLAVRSLRRRFYSHLQDLGVEQIRGRRRGPRGRTRAVEGCQTSLPHCGQGGHLGLARSTSGSTYRALIT